MSPREVAARNQRIAADPNASAFVTANAGSGKTKVLVDRIARLLLAGSSPSSFLCVTYTKAAANEMQRRLFERLGQWCVASDEELSKALGELEGENAPKASAKRLSYARALFAAALETPGGLKIQTIHAFCERLLARFPIEAGVAPGFDIVDDGRAQDLMGAARARVILEAQGETRGAFERFAARFASDDLQRLMTRLTHDAARLQPWAARVSELEQRHGGSAPPERVLAEALAQAPWEDLRAAIGPLEGSSKANQALADVIRVALAAREQASVEDAFAAYKAIFLTNAGEARRREPTKAIRDADASIARLFDPNGETQCVLDVIERLNAIERARDNAALAVFGAQLGQAYDAMKARAGALDFADLIAHAQRLLLRAEAAPWVLFKLDGGLDHILIDEGQDTSPGQWDLIAPLQDEFFAGIGAREKARTVFAVGDPKQSIYGFQGADPDRFLAEAQSLSQRADAGERKFVAPSLETSFRSAPEVLAAVDAAFARLNLAPGAVEGHNVVRHLASRSGEAGLVEVWPLTQRPARASNEPWDAPLDVETGASAASVLAQTLAKTTRTWIDSGEAVWERGVARAMRAGDVLVLVRKRGALFRELIRAFKRAGLPAAGADRMVLRDELAVEDCLALARVALDPSDDLALACVLKGPWCDLDDDDSDLFPLAYGRSGTLVEALLGAGEHRFEPAQALVRSLIERCHAHAFDFFSWALESVFEDGRSGWERVLARLGAEARDPLEELLARAANPSAHVAPNLQRFVHDIESDEGQVKREMEDAGGNVRVMTVHGAKGLEAPVVILPDTTGPVNAAADDGVTIDESGPYLFGAKGKDDKATRAARERGAERAMGEHWRLLYVAMTRARDRLIVCGAQHGNSKGGEAEESWRLAVEQALAPLATPIETPFGDGLRLGAPLQASGSEAPSVRSQQLPDWARQPAALKRGPKRAAPSRLKRHEPPVFSPRSDSHGRFRRGRLIHGLLQRLPEIDPSRRAAAARTWLARHGAEESEVVAFAEEALRVIEDGRFAAVFAPGGRAEAPIVGAYKGASVHGVVDRMAITDGDVMLLDFKTDRPAPDTAESAPAPYVLQMALYRAVVSAIFPGKPVRCALLWTEKPLLVELTPAQMESQLAGFEPG